MKTFILALLFSCSGFADYNSRDCFKSDVRVSLDLHERYFEPRFIYLKSSDVLCLTVTDYLSSAVSFSVQRQPISDSLKPLQSKSFSLKISAVGEYKINLRGRFYFNDSPTIIVLDSKPFEDLQKSESLRSAVQNHH